MSEDLNEKFDPADLDLVATDKDKASAKLNIVMQLRKSMDVRGNMAIKFADGKSQKIPMNVMKIALDKYNSFRKPATKEALQTAMSKSYKDMINALKTMREEVEELEELTAAEKILVSKMYDKKGNLTPLGKKVMSHGDKGEWDMKNKVSALAPKRRHESVELEEGFSPKEVKMAVGVASDKRYAGGNMSGAVKAIDKIKKGLSSHPQVAAVLKRQNEELEEATATTKQKKALTSLMTKALGGKKSKPGYTSSIASNGDFVAYDGGMRIQGRIKKGDFTNPMTESYGSMNASVDKVKIQKQIDQTEKHMKTFFGNTSSVKMKKFAMQKKIEKLKAQLKEAVSIEEAVLLNRDYKIKDGKVYISKANFRKVHKDFKATAKGNEKMMVNGGSKGTILAPVVFEEVDLEEGQMAGWIAIYKGKKIEIKKDQAKDLYGAKQLAIKQLKVPKSGQGILSITPAYESVNESFEIVQDGGKTEVTDIQEAPTYKLHHNTFSAAVQEAIAVAKKQGYDVDEDDWSDKVATGPKKPSKDKTNRYSVKLTKSGKPTRKFLQIQVYNMGSKYELNCYVQ